MQVLEEIQPLRLVKSADTYKYTTTPDSVATLTGSQKYYKQVEGYAQQIRHTSDVNEIISILDVVLAETRDLQSKDEVVVAQAQVQHAERKIELIKGELEQLRELVHTDQMTGVFNRRGLDEVFVREASRADRNRLSLGVVMIDLDNFKQVNDTHGHQFGDRALKCLATVAKETVRPSDIVARFGGEEFAILLPDISEEDAVTVIHRIQNNLAKKCSSQFDNGSFSFTFSSGLAIRKFGESQTSVVGRADEALYQAKHSGKNRVVAAIS